MDSSPPGKTSRDRSRAALDALCRTRADLIGNLRQQVTSGEAPSPTSLARLARLDEVSNALKSLEPNRKRGTDLVALGVATLVLLTLCLIRLPHAPLDVTLRATSLKFDLLPTTTVTLLPGEAGQILSLEQAIVSGVEDASPSDAAPGGRLELNAETVDGDKTAPVKLDPSVRLYAIQLSPGAKFSVDTRIAYSGDTRGLDIAAQGSSSIEADFGRLIRVGAPGQPLTVSNSAIQQVSVRGKMLRFALYPAEKQQDLAVFRNTAISSVAFEEAGDPTILSGAVDVGDGGQNFQLRPSDLLTVRSAKPMIVRALSLQDGQLNVIMSAPEATVLRLGRDSPKDLRPSLLQWLLFHWPNELYAAVSAAVATWLAVRRWWET
ncbi:hypothetical protein LB543_33555 [Mesorhizobium sp. ESP7-2]|uniref:hypothetical protein n=1 Tax=Mesorhizobium sp. ESP7-2 TaxID=2876622 RepID=UPI001CCFDA04|nr:hypothetical protein [Mesorhizobium sp. ESP7-2]MBZ9711607.1 hypothetical protein [Mesorhizobium sp. ESP7-2]